MGEVYRARDSKLGRDVALKFLPESFAVDAERAARFKREAQVLAALNHPAIAAIHGLDESGPTPFLVLELVEGGTLADRLRHGALPLDEALHVAAQVADALEAAHERGIIHRDLKPANIALTADDRVKVLDFGLAKAIDPASGRGDAEDARLENSPTVTSPAAMTQVGVLLGTAAYMSPEQAKGRAVDRRCDIWAFGCVLYEMVTGRVAFPGDDVLETLSAVMRGEPDWSALPADLPASVRSVLRRCLQKDPKLRLRDIGGVRLFLEEGSSAAPPSAAQATSRQDLWWQAAGALVVAAVAAGLGGLAARRLTPPAVASVVRFTDTLPAGQEFSRIGHQTVALSPDGTQMVYVASGRLYLRSMATHTSKAIPGTETGAEHPAFSPDGQSIVFRSLFDSTLKRVAVTGGAATTLCPANTTYGISWSAIGILFGQGGKGILRVAPDGGTPEVLVAVRGREDAHGPQLLPGGQHVLFTLATGSGGGRWDAAQIVVQTIATGERKILITGGTDGRYLSTGHLVYGLAGVLFAAPFDVRRIELAGGPVPVVEGVLGSGDLSGSRHFSTSDTGSLVYVPGPAAIPPQIRELALVDRKGVAERLTLPEGGYANPRVSPDGRRVAVSLDDGRNTDIWIYELSGASAMRRLTFGARNRLPTWSPDSRQIAFQSDRDGDDAIFAQPADGSGAAARLTTPEPGAVHAPESWSPDGARILFNTTTADKVSLWTLSLPDGTTAPFGGVESTEPTNAAFSRDGRFVAYSSTTAGGRSLFVQPFPATGAQYEVSSTGLSFYPVWSLDGKELVWAGRGGFNVARITTEPSFTFASPAVLSAGGLHMTGPAVPRTYDVLPDGRFLGTIIGKVGADVSIPRQIHVVLNWFEELRARVPVV